MKILLYLFLGWLALFLIGHLLERFPWTGLIIGPCVSIKCWEFLESSPTFKGINSDGSPAAFVIWPFLGLYKLFLVGLVVMGVYVFGRAILVLTIGAQNDP